MWEGMGYTVGTVLVDTRKGMFIFVFVSVFTRVLIQQSVEIVSLFINKSFRPFARDDDDGDDHKGEGRKG